MLLGEDPLGHIRIFTEPERIERAVCDRAELHLIGLAHAAIQAFRPDRVQDILINNNG